MKYSGAAAFRRAADALCPHEDAGVSGELETAVSTDGG